MRVLMVGPFARRRGENDGGVSAVMSYLADAMQARGDVELHGARICAGGKSDGIDKTFGFDIHEIAVRRFGFASGFIRQRWRFAEILKQVRPDIIHGQGADICGLLGLRSGLPAIVTVHGILGEDARFQTRVVARIRESISSRLIERPVIRESRALILISPYVAEYYGEEIGGRIHHIPNPVDQSYFDVQPTPIPGRILFAGRVIPRKGVVELVKAFAGGSHPDRRLVLAGSLADKAYVAEVRRLVGESGIENRVDFLGLLPDAQMRSELAKCQVMALPSFQETAPMVILQAMAAGVPVIASRICGIPHQVIEGITGLMTAPGNVEELKSGLEALLTDPARARSMGQNARNTAIERYHAHSVAAATVAAYRATLGGRTSR